MTQFLPRSQSTAIPVAAIAIAVMTAVAPAIAAAQSADAALGARKGQFRVMALNVGILGGMARGNIEYDAERATIAAQNLAAIGTLDQSFNWPEGTDNATIENTRALPAIWEDTGAFLAAWSDYGTAAAAIVDAVGSGPEALGPALGQVGGTCNSCHDDFRASNR
ncbi:MAG: cytochrome c [Pseudomonadota bacterium]